MTKFACPIIIALSIISTALSGQNDLNIDTILKTYYQDHQPGVAVAIIREGELTYKKHVGLASLEHDLPINDSSSFLIASVSKQFTTYLALILEEASLLNMNDDVRDHLKELNHLPYAISLKQLANHTHGLPNVSELMNVKGFGVADRLWHEDVVNIALNIQNINFEPGSDYQYNNTGYVLLAEVISRTLDIPFYVALDQYIFKPLEMNDSKAYSSPNQLIKNRVKSYLKDNQGTYFRKEVNVMSNGSSGIRTSINDMIKWSIHFQKSVMHDTKFSAMINPSLLNNGTALSYGLGLETKNYNGMEVVFHGGGDGGFRAYTLHIPEKQFSVVVLSNAGDYWPLAIAYQILDEHFPVFKAKVINKYKENDVLKYQGIYESSPGNFMVFKERNDTLFFSALGDNQDYSLPLTQLDKHTFAYPFYPEAKLVFTDKEVQLFIADFVYKSKRVNPRLQTYEAKELQKFLGFYHNKSLNTTYEIALVDDQLIARHPINFDIILRGLKDDVFFTGLNYFGQIQFIKNKNLKVIGFELSGQNIRSLMFERLN